MTERCGGGEGDEASLIADEMILVMPDARDPFMLEDLGDEAARCNKEQGDGAHRALAAMDPSASRGASGTMDTPSASNFRSLPQLLVLKQGVTKKKEAMTAI